MGWVANAMPCYFTFGTKHRTLFTGRYVFQIDTSVKTDNKSF
jgi:hypothetical protein